MQERSKADEALRRYAKIDPLVARELERGQKSALLREQAEAHAVSVSTLKRYARRFEAEGLDGLKRRKRSDAGKARRMPEEALQRAVELRRELPSRSTRKIIRMLENEHPEWRGRIKRSTLDGHFQRLEVTRRILGEDPTSRRRFAKARRNALWQTDICMPKVQVHEDGELQQAVLVAVLDDATRLCVGAEFFVSEQAWVVESTLRKAIARYGAPLGLYLDNGAQFCARHIAAGCRELSIRHLRARPGEPQGKGKVERWFRTFQESFVPELTARSTPPDLAELNRLLWAWIDHHYHQSEHRELGSTPLRCWDQDTTPARRIDPVTLAAAFLLRAERVVDKTRLVSLSGQRYLVEKALPRQRVQVRYRLEDLGEVQIWRHGEFLQSAFPYEVPANSPRGRRQAPAPAPAVPSTSYVDQLDAQRQEALAQEREAIRSRPPAAVPAGFCETDFVNLLVEVVGVELSEADRAEVRRTWRQCERPEPGLTRAGLERAVAQWGKARHLSVYLDAILQTHQRRREVEGGV